MECVCVCVCKLFDSLEWNNLFEWDKHYLRYKTNWIIT